MKYVDAITNFSVDVSFNLTNGVEAAKVVKRFVEDKRIGDCVRVMMLLLKQFLVQRYLNEVYTGGLGSYALLCLIVSFLKVLFFSYIDAPENTIWGNSSNEKLGDTSD